MSSRAKFGIGSLVAGTIAALVELDGGHTLLSIGVFVVYFSLITRYLRYQSLLKRYTRVLFVGPGIFGLICLARGVHEEFQFSFGTFALGLGLLLLGFGAGAHAVARNAGGT